MNRIRKLLVLLAVLLAVFCITVPSVSAENTAYYSQDTLLYGEVGLGETPDNATLGDLLYFATPQKHLGIVKAVYPNESTKPGVYTYGDRLRITYAKDGTLSVVTHSISKKSDKSSLSFPAQILSFIGLHEVTDIHTVTRTDYSKNGDVLLNISLSGYFEIGAILPSASHHEPIGYWTLGDSYKMLGQDADEIDEKTIYYYSAIKTNNETIGYNLYLILNDDGSVSCIDEVGEPCVSEQPPGNVFIRDNASEESEIYTVEYVDKGFFAPQITARMSAWFLYDGVHAPEAIVVDLIGITHGGDYLCTDEYTIETNEENGITTVIGVITAQKVSDPNEVIEYTLKLTYTKDGIFNSSKMKKEL